MGQEKQRFYQGVTSNMKGWILGLGLLGLASTGFASIKSGADRLINQVDPALNIGIKVVDLNSGVTLYQRNAARLFIPASNMKLFSDAAALMVLGPDYKFRNTLSIGVSEQKNGVLRGNLYIKLPGDPSFSQERLANLFASLRKMDVHAIEGNVIIDSDHAVVDAHAPGILTEDLFYSYGAPIAPVMIDANRMLVTVNPAATAGRNAIVDVEGQKGSVIIDNFVTTKPKGSRCGVDFSVDKDNRLKVRGCVTVGQWSVQQRMAIRSPMGYANQLIRAILQDNHIRFNGQVVLGHTPVGSMVVAVDYSKPIAHLMADTLKPSDNLYADSLFLHAAAKLVGHPVNWPQAQAAVKNFIQQQTEIPMQNAVLADGSGLSRNDRITADQTVGLLRFIYDRFPVTFEYIAALPISGRDGTLQRRFKRPDQQDMVRAKTGTMRGIVSLSGYLYTANAHTLAFAIYLNRMPGMKPAVSGRFRYLVDALCSYFLQQKPSNNAWVRLFSSKKRISYQQKPTQADLIKARASKWRHLESVFKAALNGQQVDVIFRGNSLVLLDHQGDMGRVMGSLKKLRARYPFAVEISSRDKPSLDGKPVVLWRNTSPKTEAIKREWIVYEAAG